MPLILSKKTAEAAAFHLRSVGRLLARAFRMVHHHGARPHHVLHLGVHGIELRRLIGRQDGLDLLLRSARWSIASSVSSSAQTTI
jgi:hypothetical protein